MGTWRGTGRRALAVGAGALLIGALGAGPAYAGTDNDDDEYTYVDDSCSDYHESWYFEHGYDYDEHWDDDWDHGDRWDKDHWDKDRWDHGKDWHQGDDWKKHWNDSDFYVRDGKVYDKKTNKPVFDLGTGLPIELPIQVPIQDPNTATVLTAPQQNAEPEKTVTEAPKTEQKTEQKTETSEQAPAKKQSAPSTVEKAPAVVQPETVTPPEAKQPEVKKPASVATDETGTKTPVEIDNKAVVTGLAAGDPWDDKDKDKDRDQDRDRDWDRDKDDHGWWDGWWEKESYTVNVSCYEDKESSHRWYDDRPVGKVEATEVKTVPKGGVNTGN